MDSLGRRSWIYPDSPCISSIPTRSFQSRWFFGLGHPGLHLLLRRWISNPGIGSWISAGTCEVGNRIEFTSRAPQLLGLPDDGCYGQLRCVEPVRM